VFSVGAADLRIWIVMDTIISNSATDTESHGFHYAEDLKSGAVIGLSGDLGAGKTCWVRGLARNLGVVSRVYSPTFALLHEYEGGRVPLFHLDLYRLESVDEIYGAGLEQYLLNPAGITVVEWIERWVDFPPISLSDYRKIYIEILDEFKRKIVINDRKNNRF